MFTLIRVSPVSGKLNSMTLPITYGDFLDYQAGKLGLVQDAFPTLSSTEREFIMTGIAPGEWEALFKEY